MGCLFSSGQLQPTEQQLARSKPQMSIELQIKKLRIKLQQKQQKLTKQFYKDINTFKQKLIKNEKQRNRNKILQFIQLENCCRVKNQIHFCSILKLKFIALQQNQQHLNKPQTFYVVKPILQDILYLEPCLIDQDLKRFSKIIKSKYKDVSYHTPSEEIKNDPFVIHHKQNVQCSQKMVNQFVLQFAKQIDLTLEQINASGNNFSYS